MRLFVAVFPPLKLREEALRTARSLLPGDRIRWSRPENVHLTLKFLGDVDEEKLDEVHTTLESLCADHTPFDTRTAGLGAFPSARRARILWAGVRGAGFEELRSLAADLDDAIASLGFEREERPYTPHLTLGRVRGQPGNLDPLPEDAENSGFRVRQVELVESTLTPKGAVYQTVGAFALREK